MKKSVIEARQRALENSEVAPGILIRVMDKPHQHAVICSHPKVYRDMTDREIVAACAVDFRRKAQEAYDAYQSTGMTRYDNAYHKYEALADALDRDVQKADTRQAAASLKSELIMLASAASRAKLPSAPEGALLALAKEVIAVGRLYGYDGKGD